MVVPDSFTAGNTGNDTLSAAAVTGHEMMNSAADADDLAADGQRIDQDSGSIRGCADIHKIRGITVVVHNSGNMIIDISTCQNLLVGRCIFVMGTEADQDDYVFKRNTDGFIQITNQFLTDDILMHPETGHIADDNCYLVIRCYKLFEGRGFNGVLSDCLQKGSMNIFNCIHRILSQRLNAAGAIYGDGDFIFTILQRKIFHHFIHFLKLNIIVTV